MTLAPASSPRSADLAGHRYRLLIGDHVGKRILGEMPAADVAYVDELNRPGACSFRVPLDHPAVTPDVVWPGRRVMFVERDGLVVWGGWIVTCRTSGASLEVAGEGWYAYLRRRYRLGPWRWANSDQMAIAVAILGLMTEDADAMPAVTYDTLHSGTFRAFEWLGHDKTCAAAIDELAAMAGGFDWSMRYAWTANGWPAPTLHLHYPWRGVRHPTPIDSALPLVELSVAVDSSPVAASISVFGRDNPDFPEAPWTDRWSIRTSGARALGFPELQTVEAARDVDSLAELDALAKRRMLTTSDCSVVPSVTFASGGDELGDLEQLAAGDVVHVVHRQGWIDLDGWYRVMARSVSVDVDGTERTRLDLAPVVLAGGPS